MLAGFFFLPKPQKWSLLVTFGHIFAVYHMSILTQLPEKQGFSWIPLAETVSLQTLEWECYILIISP
jgi:hypothetical protein